MTSPTRDRSPLFVYRYGNANAGYPWAWVCRKCDESQISYSAHWRALRDALDHWNDCPALRLARLEAELEKLAETHAEAATETSYAALTSPFPDTWYGRTEVHQRVNHDLTAILARHRQASA